MHVCVFVFAFIYAMQIGMHMYAFVININFRNVSRKNAKIDAKHRRAYLPEICIVCRMYSVYVWCSVVLNICAKLNILFEVIILINVHIK